MNKELTDYLTDQGDICSGDSVNEIYEAAERFHRLFPRVRSADGVEKVARKCMSSCHLGVCRRRDGCTGGIVYANELAILESNAKGPDKRDASYYRKLVNMWKNM